jgi:NAD(P)-dependent dehydrogenase (short-subunit alcohol dehydrogenase family)
MLCQSLVDRALREFGKLDVLVNNAAMQRTHESIDEISSDEWDRTFRTNIYSMFYLSKAALRHMQPGAAIVNTASINSKSPSPNLLAYATTKGAIANFTAGLIPGQAMTRLTFGKRAEPMSWTARPALTSWSAGLATIRSSWAIAAPRRISGRPSSTSTPGIT